MRLKVSYKVNSISIGYRMTVLSLLKEAIRHSDVAYYTCLFEINRKEMKPFTTAVYLKDFNYCENKINLSELTITISASNECMIHLFNGLQQLAIYQTSGETWIRTDMELVKEDKIRTSSVLFSTRSPILVEDRSGKPLHPIDENYEKEINYYAALKARKFAKRELYQLLRITPVSMKKTVIKETNSTYRKSSGHSPFLYYTAYRGLLKIEGHPEDLQLIYLLGIGKRNAQSFGLLDLVKEEVE
ncbi:hypothetical protein B4102_2383 [Heyndrickxia sporothermodurans]|uniref:CRISPR associated protein Cas6 C-terminal domain-containing protein n=1 Tax=Heyndrickxia sporothermodurans TaxID=46224 RepID=A0A150LCK5_9BACI|nr:CRISPR-associated endoribonuclease Cas6 [Heyndrickxia sporothermodurans]KYD09970.1 hypothetical protein B4102_2383 [Heyndrickxia sporothermodurans]